MMGALAFIPEYSRQKYLLFGKTEEVDQKLPYFELFNPNSLSELWSSIILQINSLYCQVHRINQANPLFMSLVAASYSLP
jgi:hypothetical protein